MTSVMNDYDFDSLSEILSDEGLLFKLRFLMTRLPDFYYRCLKENINDFCSYEMTNYIKTFKFGNVNIDLTNNAFFALFRNYKFLFQDESIINSKNIKDFLEDNNRDKYNIKSIADLDNFLEIRKKYYLLNPSENDEFMSLFGIPKVKLLEKIKTYLKANFLSKKETDLL